MGTIFEYINTGASAVLPFVILLGLLIFVHELGHFLVAKFFGVRVEVFSLGFGKKIFQRKRGDTVYCLSLIPLGGYVKMFGDEVGANIAEADKQFSYLHKPVMQRIGVVVAGPLMNLFFAAFIFLIVAFSGEQVRGPKVGDISTTSEAYKIGFRSGDTISEINSKPVKTWEEIQDFLNLGAAANNTQPLKIKVVRETGSQSETFEVRPVLLENPNILSLDSHIGDISGLNPYSKQAIIGVRGNTLAAESGFKTGDRVISVNSLPIQYFRELENAFISQQGQEIHVAVERFEGVAEGQPGKNLTVNIKASPFSSLNGLGLESSELYLYKIAAGTPAERAGLKAADLVLKINDIKPQHWDDILNTVKAYKGEGTIHFEVERGEEVKTFEIKPEVTSQMTSQDSYEKRYTVGIIPTLAMANPVLVKLQADSLSSAWNRAMQKTWDVTAMTVLSFLRLIQNKISPKNIGGVISIGQAASETFKIGYVHFLQMMAIISVNLFVLNLLPIPVLDGGHLLFYSIEAIRGAPVSMRKMEIAQQVGLVVLMSLMVFALFNDFSRLMGL